jgi:hypothetical protein
MAMESIWREVGVDVQPPVLMNELQYIYAPVIDISMLHARSL